MKAEGFLWVSSRGSIFLEGQKDSDYPKLEVLRREVSDVPVCRPETVLAYIWSGQIARSGENTWSGVPGEGKIARAGGNRRNGKCPVLLAAQKDRILEIVIEHMDRYCRGDGGDEL